jgi:putative restriction endonuclease
MERKNWSPTELLLVLNLYYKLPLGKCHKGTPEVKEIAALIGRSPSAVSMRLGNYISLDPLHRANKIGGLKNISRDLVETWEAFHNDREAMVFEAERLQSELEHQPLSSKYPSEFPLGEEKDQLIRARVNQAVFRRYVLTNYGNTCAISGINIPELLVASHIVPWAVEPSMRLRPDNGLCLGSLYDQAFDKGFLTIDVSYRVVLSSELRKKKAAPFFEHYFGKFENQPIQMPEKYLPNQEALAYHRNNAFLG